jgi:multiple sugar transport system permease protein
MVTGALKSGQEIAQTPPTLFPQAPADGNYADAWNRPEPRQADVQHLLLRGRRGLLPARLRRRRRVRAVQAAAGLRQRGPRPDAGDPDDPGDGADRPAVRDRDRPADRARSLLDSPWAIWLPLVANAFNIFLLKRFFDSIPED